MNKILPFIVVVLFMACNVTNRMDRQADRAINNPYIFGKVGTAWIIKNGCLADTIRDTLLQGVPYVYYRDTTIHDTIRQPVPCKAFTYKTPRGVIVSVDTAGRLTVEDKRKDSVVYVPQVREISVTDRKQVNALLDSLGFYKKLAALREKDVKISQANERQAKTMRNVLAIGWALTAAGAGLFLFKSKLV